MQRHAWVSRIYAVPLLGDAHYRQVPVCGASRIVPKVWMGRDHPSLPVLRTFVTGGRYIRLENKVSVHSRSPDHVLEIVDSQTVALFDRRAFRLARESGETLYISDCTHRKRQRQGRKKKDTDRVIVEVSLVGKYPLHRSDFQDHKTTTFLPVHKAAPTWPALHHRTGYSHDDQRVSALIGLYQRELC